MHASSETRLSTSGSKCVLECRCQIPPIVCPCFFVWQAEHNNNALGTEFHAKRILQTTLTYAPLDKFLVNVLVSIAAKDDDMRDFGCHHLENIVAMHFASHRKSFNNFTPVVFDSSSKITPSLTV